MPAVAAVVSDLRNQISMTTPSEHVLVHSTILSSPITQVPCSTTVSPSSIHSTPLTSFLDIEHPHAGSGPSLIDAYTAPTTAGGGMDPVEFEGFEQDGDHGLGDDAYGEEEEAVEMEAVSSHDGTGRMKTDVPH